MKARTPTVALLVFLATLSASFAAGGTRKIESTSSDRIITLDGDRSEWEGIPAIYLKDSVHVLTVANDDEHVYLMFRFADETLARNIMWRGVTLWFNGDGKTKNKKEEFAVRYPGSAQIADHLESAGEFENGQNSGDSDRMGGRTPPPELASLHQVPGQLTVIVDGVKSTVDESNSAGPAAASAVTDSSFCYEFRIPFSAIGGKAAAAPVAAERQIAIGIQIGGTTKAEQKMIQSVMREQRGDMGSSPGPGGIGGLSDGGRRTGMGKMGGGMSGQPAGGGRPDFEPEIFWLSVTLQPKESS